MALREFPHQKHLRWLKCSSCVHLHLGAERLILLEQIKTTEVSAFHWLRPAGGLEVQTPANVLNNPSPGFTWWQPQSDWYSSSNVIIAPSWHIRNDPRHQNVSLSQLWRIYDGIIAADKSRVKSLSEGRLWKRSALWIRVEMTQLREPVCLERHGPNWSK